MLKLRPTYEQMLKEARTRRLKILPEKQKRTQQGILLDDVDVSPMAHMLREFDEFDLSSYDRRIDINNNGNRDKATQTDFNLASSSHSSVGEDFRTQEEVKEEVGYEPSVKSNETPVSKQEQKTREGKSLMRRMFESMFEETEVDMVPLRGALGSQTVPSRQVSVATEESQASSSSLPTNVKKSYEPSPTSSHVSSSTNRSALLPVAGNTLTPQVSPDVISSSRPSERSVENVQSSAPSNRTIEYLQSSEPSDRTIESLNLRHL